MPLEPRTVLDLGANVGYASVYFALRYARTRVVAVEPEPSNAALLRRNIAAFPQIELVQAAVWPRRGWVAMDDVGKGYWGMRVSAVDGGVRAVTVPDLLEHMEEDWVDLVKVDIEGSEIELFTDNTEWLSRVGVLVIELHDRFRAGCREAVESALARSWAGFSESQQGEAVVLVRDAAPRPHFPNSDSMQPRTAPG